MHRCPCHQANQLPCRTSNRTSSSFSFNYLHCKCSFTSSQMVFRGRCFVSVHFLSASECMWECDSMRGGGKKERPTAAGGATSSLSCGPVTWASTSGGTAEAGEGLLFIRREAVKMISQLTFVPLLCQYQQFCFNTSWLRGRIAVIQNTLASDSGKTNALPSGVRSPLSSDPSNTVVCRVKQSLYKMFVCPVRMNS